MRNSRPIDFFNLFFTDEVKNLIYKETCRYAQIRAKQSYLKEHPHARAHDWIKNPMTRDEVDSLLSIIITLR